MPLVLGLERGQGAGGATVHCHVHRELPSTDGHQVPSGGAGTLVQVIFAHWFRFIAELAVTTTAAKAIPHAPGGGVGPAAPAAPAAPPVAMSLVAALLKT